MSIKSIVLVHGAFADGSSWSKLIPLLAKHGYTTIAVQNPLSSLADDVTATHRVLDEVEGPALLVGHSWGGAVITEAGNHAKVAGLVYVAAGAPDSGQSFNEWWKDYAPMSGATEIKPYGSDGYVAFSPAGVEKYFAQDLPQEETALIYAMQGPLAARCFGDKISTAAWRSKPSWYIVAENDLTIPPAVEKDSAAKMNATTLSLPTSHVPMLSQPGAVADFILSALQTLAKAS